VAAMSVAKRVSEEMSVSLGEEVGYTLSGLKVSLQRYLTVSVMDYFLVTGKFFQLIH